MKRLSLLALGLPVSLLAQAIDWSILDRLADKARQSAVVNLGPEQLSLIAGLKGKEQAEMVSELAKGLKSVQVRSFEFDAPGMYDLELVRSLRDRIKASGEWASLVSVRQTDGFTEIMVKKPSGDKPGGLLIIGAEARQLSVVHIEGAAHLSVLGRLGGLAGIPEIETSRKKALAPDRRKDEKK
jgi:hypothetical protein